MQVRRTCKRKPDHEEVMSLASRKSGGSRNEARHLEEL
jgi:hypothetical protein